MPANPEGLLPVEQREAIARIIDPSAWRARDGHLARVEHWFALVKTHAGAAELAEAFRVDAIAAVRPSLEKADAILALPAEPASTGAAIPEVEQSLARPGMEEMREALKQIGRKLLAIEDTVPIAKEAQIICLAALSQVPSQEGK